MVMSKILSAFGYQEVYETHYPTLPDDPKLK